MTSESSGPFAGLALAVNAMDWRDDLVGQCGGVQASWCADTLQKNEIKKW